MVPLRTPLKKHVGEVKKTRLGRIFLTGRSGPKKSLPKRVILTIRTIGKNFKEKIEISKIRQFLTKKSNRFFLTNFGRASMLNGGGGS